MADPIEDSNSSLKNLDWMIETGRLEKQFDKVYLINDLVVMACALPSLEDKGVVVLQSGLQLKEGGILLVAVGAQLGQAFLFPTGSGKYYAVDSDQGHADFAPRKKLIGSCCFYAVKNYMS